MQWGAPHSQNIVSKWGLQSTLDILCSTLKKWIFFQIELTVVSEKRVESKEKLFYAA